MVFSLSLEPTLKLEKLTKKGGIFTKIIIFPLEKKELKNCIAK